MEGGLRFGIALFGRDRTGAAGRTGMKSAILAGPFDMTMTGGMIVGTCRRESRDRTSRKAGTVTSFTGM